MIKKLNNKDINKIMEIWEKSTIKAHDFISKEYWQNNYNTVKNEYIPISDTFVSVSYTHLTLPTILLV